MSDDAPTWDDLQTSLARLWAEISQRQSDYYLLSLRGPESQPVPSWAAVTRMWDHLGQPDPAWLGRQYREVREIVKRWKW